MNRLEGNSASRFLQIMKSEGQNTGMYATVATVSKASPALAIRVDGDPFDLEDSDLIIADHLLQHTRIATISKGVVSGETTNVSAHSHSIQTITWQDAEIEFTDKLKVGDQVAVLVAQEGQLYYVLDKV